MTVKNSDRIRCATSQHGAIAVGVRAAAAGQPRSGPCPAAAAHPTGETR